MFEDEYVDDEFIQDSKALLFSLLLFQITMMKMRILNLTRKRGPLHQKVSYSFELFQVVANKIA